MKTISILFLMLMILAGQKGMASDAQGFIPNIGTLKYRRTSDNKTTYYTIAVTIEGETVIYLSKSETFEFQHIVDKKTGFTLKSLLNKKDTELIAEKRNGSLNVSGRVKGKQIKGNQPLEGIPWIQSLEAGLGSLTKSSEQKINFWIINPNDGSINKMVAVKEDVVSIDIGDKKVITQLIKVTLPNWMSFFWSTDYYHRLKDGLFVRFKGKQGPPGTPEVIIEISE